MANPVSDEKGKMLAEELYARKRAHESLIDFTKYIDVPGAPVSTSEESNSWVYEPIETGIAAHHILILDVMQKVIMGKIPRAMFFLPPGSAKALALDTPIPTPDGWKTMGELKVGDQVFGDDGKPCNVTWKSMVFKDRPCFDVKTDCGDVIVADNDHEWLVRLCGKPRKPLKPKDHKEMRGRACLDNRDDPMSQFKIKETWELARRRAKKPMIKRASALDLPEQDLPVDPYVLGVWLGDGNTAGLRITCGLEDQKFIRSEFERLGYKTTDQSVATNFGFPGCRDKFAELGLLNGHGKFIPSIYLRSSHEQRLRLMQGLIDSDGTVCRKRGCTTFSNTNKKLAIQVRELVRSLGVKAGWSEGRAKLNSKDCGAYYSVRFYLKDAALLPRKAILTRNQTRTPNTYIDVERTENADTVCIEVDSPTHLFLAGKSMTPTHNSTFCSSVAPVWAMGRLPNTKIILASYGGELAKKHGRKARAIVKSKKYQSVFSVSISEDTSAADMWATSNDSEYMSAGILSGITGNRANGLIIDDPIKGRADADSKVVRDKTWDAYQDDLRTRLVPGGWEIVVQTRWHEDDLSGRLLPKDYDGESGMLRCEDGRDWYILNIPAQCENKDDPLNREIGEYLWPEWFTAEHFEGFKKQTRTWSALFQQRPSPDEGTFFKREWFHLFQSYELPRDLHYYITSDFATKADEGDFTEHGVWGIDERGDIWLVDWWYGQTTADTWITELLALMQVHKPMCWFGEGGVIRRAIEPFLTRMMTDDEAYCRIEWINPVTDKATRSRAFQSMASRGKVHFPDSLMGHRVIDQLLAFPVGAHDDAVDVCSLMGMVIDQAHPAVVNRKNERPKTQAEKDWARIHGVEDEDEAINVDDI